MRKLLVGAVVILNMVVYQGCSSGGGEKLTCEDHTSEPACSKDERCVWDAGQNRCVTKSLPITTIYTWKKLSIPNSDKTDAIGRITMSKDKKFFYLLLSLGGFYYSDDQGDTWKKMANYNAKVDPAALVSVPCLVAETDIADIIPTGRGVAISSRNSVCLIEGGQVVFGISRSFNHDGAVIANAYPVAGFKDHNIAFLDVVDINGVETMAFGQNPHADTHYMVWFKRTDNYLAPERVKIIKSVATGGALLGQQSWMRAGNAHNGDLLLASVSGTKGIWHIPKEHLPGGASFATPANKGAALHDDPVMFPENGTPWVGTTASPQENVRMMAIGSFADRGAHTYYAAMSPQQINAAGGLAHHHGVQGAGHAALDFSGIAVLGLNNFGGKTRLKTTNGFKGVNVDGTPHSKDDYKLSDFSLSKDHMMQDDKKALPFDDKSGTTILRDIYGDDDLAWYVIAKDLSPTTTDSISGIYRREKKQGHARP